MNYWVVIDRRKMGPLSLEDLRRLPLDKNSYVWHRGLPAWVKAGELEELADLFVPSATDDVEALVASDAPLAEEVAEDNDEAVANGDSQEESRPAAFPPPPPLRPNEFRSVRYGGRPAPPAKPPTYLGWSIASIICCCLLTGIVAVIYAAKVTPLYYMGRYEEARRASEKAEIWLIVSITVGIVALPFQFLMAMF